MQQVSPEREMMGPEKFKEMHETILISGQLLSRYQDSWHGTGKKLLNKFGEIVFLETSIDIGSGDPGDATDFLDITLDMSIQIL